MYENNVYHSPYIVYIKSLLNDLGLHGIWLNQENLTFSLTWFKEKVKRCLMDQYIQKWQAEIFYVNRSIYWNYRMYKNNFACEHYFEMLPTSYIILLTRFRTLNNRLPVQTERFRDTPRHERICTKCDTNDVGDEYHMLFVCPHFKIQRSLYISPKYWKKPSALKFNALFSSRNKKCLVNLVKFIRCVNKEFTVSV